LVANDILTTVTDKYKIRVPRIYVQVQHVLESKGDKDKYRKSRLMKMFDKQRKNGTSSNAKEGLL
jgi:hypothetical protein